MDYGIFSTIVKYFYVYYIIKLTYKNYLELNIYY